MSRASTIRQEEIKRAVAGALAAGLNVSRVEVDQINGKVLVYVSNAGPPDDAANPCDRLLK